MKRLQGILFDLDGTLVDSNDALARAWVEAMNDYGYPQPLEEIRRLVGMGSDNLIRRALGLEKDDEVAKQIANQHSVLFKANYLDDLQPTHGAKELVEHLHGEGFRLVLATSGKADEVAAMLKILGVEHLIDARATIDDVLITAALDNSGLSADEVVLLGDTPYDIVAGLGAGVSVIAFQSGGWHGADLDGAIATYTDPADLIAHYDDSVIAKGKQGFDSTIADQHRNAGLHEHREHEKERSKGLLSD
jgi:phosphoglycolate phosphatase-like HAD superfamily hydrolase